MEVCNRSVQIKEFISYMLQSNLSYELEKFIIFLLILLAN